MQLAHFSLDYYMRLEIAELEGDLFKAVTAGASVRVKTLYGKLICAKLALCREESKRLECQKE